MTRRDQTGTGTPFSKWLRIAYHSLIGSHKGFDAENLDYIWFHYIDGWLILIEEKRYNGAQTEAQCDTHSVIDQMLKIASGSEVETKRGKRPIEYRGYYLFTFENTTPDDGAFTINDKPATIDDLLHLLRNGKVKN